MGYELNTKAYALFIQIEVGLREYFIQLIKNYGVTKWTQNFLGSIQRDTLSEVSKRIIEANKIGKFPKIEDIYVQKLCRAKKDKESSFIKSNICHPFYYLNWSDLEVLMRMKTNVEIIDDSIGKISRTTIAENLKMLSFFRNDVAHSRFISEIDYRIIKAGYDQISGFIPEFSKYIEHQTKEDNIGELMNEVNKIVQRILTNKMLDAGELEYFNGILLKCKDSFWLNSLVIDMVTLVDKLIVELNLYNEYRGHVGGLRDIIKWKQRNNELFKNILNLIENGKF